MAKLQILRCIYRAFPEPDFKCYKRYVWAVLMASSAAGLWSERTQWGAAVSSPLVTMLLTITLCNVGLLPASSPVYTTINQVGG